MSDYNLSHSMSWKPRASMSFGEVAAQFERPAILFGGGKDSICVTHLVCKRCLCARPHSHAAGSH